MESVCAASEAHRPVSETQTVNNVGTSREQEPEKGEETTLWKKKLQKKQRIWKTVAKLQKYAGERKAWTFSSGAGNP